MGKLLFVSFSEDLSYLLRVCFFDRPVEVVKPLFMYKYAHQRNPKQRNPDPDCPLLLHEFIESTSKLDLRLRFPEFDCSNCNVNRTILSSIDLISNSLCSSCSTSNCCIFSFKERVCSLTSFLNRSSFAN